MRTGGIKLLAQDHENWADHDEDAASEVHHSDDHDDVACTQAVMKPSVSTPSFYLKFANGPLQDSQLRVLFGPVHALLGGQSSCSCSNHLYPHPPSI